jgi:hypothetical protein
VKESSKGKKEKPPVASAAAPAPQATGIGALAQRSGTREVDSDDDEDADLDVHSTRVGAMSVDAGPGIKMTNFSKAGAGVDRSKPPPGGQDKIDDEFVDDLLFG